MLSTTEVYETKIAEPDPEMSPPREFPGLNSHGVQVLRSGQTFGWLRKKTRRFGGSSYCPRFFTVDFDRCILYYSHSEFSNKRVSMYTPFCDIVDVECLGKSKSEPDDDAKDEPHQRCCFPRLPRLVKDDRRSFVLRTKARDLELRCASEHGSEKWIAIIKTAMLMGKDKLCVDEDDSEQSTQSCSRESSSSSMESCTATGSERSSEEEVADQFNEPMDSPLSKVRGTNIAEPGRCFSVASSNSPRRPLSPDFQSNLTLPRFSDEDAELVGSPFLVDSSESLQQPYQHHDSGPTERHASGKRRVRFLDDFDKHDQEAQPVSSIGADEILAVESKDDLQALLIDAVLSSSGTSASHNAWKKPQPPIVERADQPLGSTFEDPAAPLPTIEEEEASPRAYDIMHVTLRDRILARGVKIPPHITIP